MLDLIIKNGSCFIDGDLKQQDIGIENGKFVKIGKLKDISLNSMNENCGILVNVSRDIIYSDSSEIFEDQVRKKALEYKIEMESLLIQKGLV